MCGFAGYIAYGGVPDQTARDIGNKMAEAILHRGPDDGGVWIDAPAGVVLAHRRLAIVDLSAAGHQPMISSSGRYVIIFNGEIYNHLSVRKNIDATRKSGAGWNGHSDTETLLAAIETWGLEKALQASVGMFALAVWDRETRKLSLARDRMGEKPLYYGWQGQGSKRVFLFGSELKALKAHPNFRGEINRDAVCLQMRHNYIPAPYSIYRNISKLAPGHILEFSLTSEPDAVNRPLKSVPYWSLDDVAKSGRSDPFQGSDIQAVDALDELLRDAIGKQMLADVPLGAFLSGGVDSSAIVGIMQSLSPRPVKTFTIGFNEAGKNEAVFAKEVAARLGTDHNELYVTPQMAMDVIPQLAQLYDEPFSDSSQIPTFLVSKLAKEHVTVSLSGDAGDELFCGYSRYNAAAKIRDMLDRTPVSVRSGAARMIRSVSVDSWRRLGGPVSKLMGKNLGNVGDRAYKFADLLSDGNAAGIYHRMVSHWAEPEHVVLGAREPENYFSSWHSDSDSQGFYGEMMLADMHTYLPDDILTKVDRAAMGVSLETRVPFLDHRVVELAARIPLHMKQRDGQGKWILRQVLYKYVPQELIERPKMGFGVPIDVWLRGPLRDWAEQLLDEQRLKTEGFFDAAAVRKKWNEHISGKQNWQYHLWDVLMFQEWLDRWN